MVFRLPYVVAPGCGDIYPHETEKCAKIQQITRLVERDKQSSEKRQDSDQNDVSRRALTPRAKVTEELPRENLIAAHAVQQPRSAHLHAESRTELASAHNEKKRREQR